ncbi:MAG: protein kinase [Gemmatimonadota bacterium]|nr:protein kinase [Gemmatimonadota bacterium]MDH5550619.1 protein kinase [Gemmatimonadota bacterium]
MGTARRTCTSCDTPLPPEAKFCFACGTATPTEAGAPPSPTTPREEQLERLRQALADRYRIERVLGQGGMATVYRADDLRHQRKVAIKVLRPELAAAVGADRFLREIGIAAQLQHTHILTLIDSGDADGFLYYVMPFVEGESLRQKLVRERELPISEAVSILHDVVDALAHAHSHGVVHRDIKPDNVLLSGRHALVVDFGVAKAVSQATGRLDATTAGLSLGTPTYMAPEQAAADPRIDHRADIYAVGVMAYELLTGTPPITGDTPQAVLAAQVTQSPKPIDEVRPTVPLPLAQLVMRCLEKKPADRWQSAEELLPPLEALATPSGGMTPTGTRPLPAAVGRRRWLAPGVLAAAAVLIVIAVFGTQLLKRGPMTLTTSNIHAVTSETGLEVHPALSPDGRQVAFADRRAGRWSVVIRSTRNIAGGGELTPTQGLHEFWEYLFPRWSPDGEFVRFWTCAGDQCSWREVAKLGGSIRSIDLPRNTSDCSWSPDGARVAFIAWPDSIFTHSTTDGTTTLLAVPEVRWALHSPVWSPDGRRIAYVNGNPSWPTSFNVARSSIWIVDADGGGPVRVAGAEHMNVSPAWLDDDHLLFVSNRDGPREVYVVEVGPMGPRREPRKVPGVSDPHSISYSIAGRKLAFAKATARQNVWSYPIGSGPMSVGAGHPVTSDNAVVEEHDVSPDGRWIVYDSNLRGNMDIYKRPLEGGSPTPITDSPLDEFGPRWSPDGAEIAFYVGVGAGEGAVMVVPADGGAPVQLASGPWMYGGPKWSPSGTEIAFSSSRAGRLEVWLVSREAIGGSWGEATQLTDFGCVPADWAPDGSGVLCDAGEEMVLVSRDGDVLWRYDPSTAGLQGLSSPQFSWDGSMIYVYGTHEDGSGGIWAVPPRGGEPNLVVAYDDAEIEGMDFLSVGPDHLYVTVGEYESDIWVMDLEW